MRIALVTLLCPLVLAASGALADDKADAKKELKKFEGVWTFESVEEP